MRNTWVWSALVALGVLAGCGRNTGNAPATSQAPGPNAPAVAQGAGGADKGGQKAANVGGKTLQGKSVRLEDLRGKTVMLNFFSPG